MESKVIPTPPNFLSTSFEEMFSHAGIKEEVKRPFHFDGVSAGLKPKPAA